MDKIYNSLLVATKEYFFQNNYVKAIEYAEKAISYYASEDEAYYWLGMSKYFNNNHEDAIAALEFYTSVAKDIEKIFTSFFTLAILNTRSGDQEMVKYCLDKCAEKNNDLLIIPYHLMQSAAKIWNDLTIESSTDIGDSLFYRYGLNEIITELDDETLWKQILNMYCKNIKEIDVEEIAIFFRVLKINEWNTSHKKQNIDILEEWSIKRGEDLQLHPTTSNQNNYDKKQIILGISRPSKNVKIAYVSHYRSYVSLSNFEQIQRWDKDQNGFWTLQKKPDSDWETWT